MRTTTPRFALAALLLLLSAPPARAHNGAVALAYPVRGIVVDGDFSDWPEHLPRYPIALPELGATPLDEGDFKASLRAAYDVAEDALYFAVEVQDESIVVDTSATWGWDKEDGCEVYLDLDHEPQSTATQFTLRGVGGGQSRFDGQSRDGLPERRTAVRWRRLDGRHQYEWRLDLGGRLDLDAMGDGLTLSVDVVVCDMDADGSFSWMAWGRKIYKVGPADRRGDLILVRDPEGIGTVVGRVVWEGMDLGIAGTGLRLQAIDNPRLWTRVVTAADGHFRLDLPAGTYHLVAELGPGEGLSRQVEVGAGGTVELSLEVRPTGGVLVLAGPGTETKAGAGDRQGAWHSFGTTDGLQGGLVRGIVPDRSGMLWFGTQDGLHRFDGQFFTQYTTRDGLVGNEVTALFLDDHGDLWIGTSGGLSRFDGETYTQYTTRDGLIDNEVLAIAATASGDLWIGTNGGLSRFEDGRFVNYTVADGLGNNSVWALAADPGGDLWIGTRGGGLGRFDGAEFTHYTTADGLSGNYARALLVDGRQNLWIGTEGGLSRRDGDGFANFTAADGLVYGAVNALQEDLRGNLWISDCEQLYTPGLTVNCKPNRFDGRRFTAWDDLGDEMIFSLQADREGNVWAGTTNKLARFDAADFLHLTVADGLASNTVNALLEDRHGALWIGTEGGLNRYGGKELETFTTAQGLTDDTINHMLEDREGDLWIATEGGLNRYDGSAFESFTAAQGLPQSHFVKLLEDREGDLWMASIGGGLIRYDGTSFTAMTVEDGLPNDTVHSLAEDWQGDLWVSTWDSGVMRYDGHGFTQYTTRDGLGHRYVVSLLVDRRGDLWLGTLGGGVSRFDGERFTNFADGYGASFDNVFDITDGSSGILWLATSSGVSRYDGAVFQNLLERDGLAGNATTAVIESRDGSFWIATHNQGITRYRPSVSPPPVRIIDVITERRHGPVSSIALPSTQPLVTFEFRAISFRTRPEAVLYRYRLVGHDEAWRITRQGRVEYQDLPVGQYAFEVVAIDRDLVYSAEPARVAVEVHPPYADIALWSALGVALLAGAFLLSQVVRRNRHVRLQEARFRNLLESVGEGIFGVDGNGITTFVNPAALRLLGMEGRDLLGKGVHAEIHHHRADGCEYPVEDCPMHRSFTEGETYHVDDEVLWKRDGSPMPVEYTATPIRKDGELVGSVITFQDVTERRAAQEALRAAKESAEAANQSKSSFLANISHEIRTPMNAILGFTDILAGSVKEPQQRGYVRTIQESGKALMSLINDILDLSRVEAGTLELQESVVNVEALMEEMRLVFTAEAEKKELELRIDVAAGVPPALVMDGGRLRQILLNLVGNAVKFTERGRVQLTLSAVAMEGSEEADLTLTVRDTGMGIPEEEQKRIFGAFTQRSGQSINEYGGTGMGLAVTQSMVDVMGGRISVASQVGVGSTFTVALPKVRIATGAADTPAAEEVDVERLRFAPATVLVADDVETNRALVRGYLAPLGLQILEAADGQEAMDITRAQRPDAVLMDIKMPVLDGFTAARRLKANAELRSTPIVALTASVMKESEAEIAAVCDAFVRKPVSQSELVSTLMRFLEHTSLDEEEGAVEAQANAPEGEEVTAEARARLPELIAELEGRRPLWEELKATQTINEVEDFAHQMQELGEAYGYPPLRVWGERLVTQASTFDMVAMPGTLEQFPQIVEEARALTATQGDTGSGGDPI